MSRSKSHGSPTRAGAKKSGGAPDKAGGGTAASGATRAIAILIILLICIPPFLVIRDAKEIFRLVQGLTSGWLALASLVAAALTLRMTSHTEVWTTLWRAPAVRALLPLTVLVIASGVFTAHPVHFRAAAADFAIGAACLMGWSLALDAPTLRRLLRWTMIPAVLIAALGLDQFLGWFGTLDWLAIQAPTARLRMTSTLGNPGDLATYLVLPWLVALSALRSATPRMRALLIGGMTIALAAIAASATVAAIAAVLVATAIWWWGSTLPGRGRTMKAAGTIAIVVAVGAGTLAISPPLRGRVIEKATQLAHGEINALLTGRLDGWRAAIAMVRQSPLTGIGQGAFRAQFADTRLRLTQQGVAFYSEQEQVIQATPHNEALSVAAEQGIPGVIALAWAIWCLLAAARAIPKNDGTLDRTFAWAGLSALGTLSIVWFPMHIASVAFPWILFLAWLCRRGSAKTSPRVTSPSPVTVPALVAPALVTPALVGARALVAVPLIAALIWQTWRVHDRVTAGRLLAQVEARTLGALQARRAASTLFAENLEALERARRLDPLEIGVPIARGTQFLLLRRPDEALDAYREAAALEPRPEIDLNIGRALWMRGSKDEARAAFTRAVTLNPLLRREVPEGGL